MAYAAGVVFVANGSGDSRTVSTNLSRVAAETGTPLQVEAVVWSLGYGRNVADHVTRKTTWPRAGSSPSGWPRTAGLSLP